MLNKIREDSSPLSIFKAWEEYKTESIQTIKSLNSEFKSFLDKSIKTLNSVGYNPLLRYFLLMSSREAKQFLDKLDPKEK